MNTKYTGVKGTRDFIGKDLRKRNYLLNILKSCFESFNFQELQTPSFEKLETLIGKYGDEETNLMYKIISSGEKVKKADIQAIEDGHLTKFSNSISDKGLRYDLTVPLSRFFRDQKHFLRTPFKRYQIQNVWRAERPQKGRFREFLQCDVDTIGKSSDTADVIHELSEGPSAVACIANNDALGESIDVAISKQMETDECIEQGNHGVVNTLKN